MRTMTITVAVSAFGLAACSAPETAGETDATDAAAPGEPDQATTTLVDADGEEVGVVIAMRTAEGVWLNIMADGLTPGTHGAHIHETGSCEPDFMASGDHWGPYDAELGLANDDPGDDSENATITVGEDGTGALGYTLSGEVTLDGILDEDGSAFVIHQRSQQPVMETPSGNGDRIACGVFKAGPQ